MDAVVVADVKAALGPLDMWMSRWHAKWFPDKFMLSNFLRVDNVVTKMPQDVDPLAEQHPLEVGKEVLRGDWEAKAFEAVQSHPRMKAVWLQVWTTDWVVSMSYSKPPPPFALPARLLGDLLSKVNDTERNNIQICNRRN